MGTMVFTRDNVKKLNDMAFEIDNRLFLFAYYNPKEITDDMCHREQFVVSVLNVYGLIKDCGPFINNLIFDRNYSIIPMVNNRSDWKISQNFKTLWNAVNGIRSVVCHNNYEEYHFNKERKKLAKDYLDMYRIGDSTRIDWESALSDFTDLAKTVYDGLVDCLNYVKTCAEYRRNAIVNLWLNMIIDWYKNEDLILNVLADIYTFQYNSTYPNNDIGSVNRSRVTNWIGKDNLRRWTGSNESMKAIAHSDECPLPALPIECIKSMIWDVCLERTV